MARRKIKTKARGNGEGTVYKREVERSDGSTYERWEAKVTTGYTPEGKRKRSTLYGRSYAEVLQKLEAIKRQVADGTFTDVKLTVGEYLERWHTEKAREVKPRTIELYREQAKLHILTEIGGVKLAKLSPMHLQNLCSGLADNVGKRTANLVRVQMFTALKQAVRWQLIPRNPAEAVAPIRVEKKPITIWTPTEAARFLDTARAHRLYALFYLAMSTGLRRGELLSLQWSSIKGGSLRVVTSKTRKGQRTVKLSQDVLTTLEAHKVRMQAERARFTGEWPETGLVFVSEVGTPINPRNLEREWYKLQEATRKGWAEELTGLLESHDLATPEGERTQADLKRLEARELLPKVRLHDLRHLHASMLIKGGKTSVEVAERLGHTNPSFTVDTYGHIFREHQAEEEVSILDYLPTFSKSN